MSIIFYIIALIILSPLIALGIESFVQPSENFEFLVFNVLDDVILNSLSIMSLTVIGVLVIGVSCARLCVQYDFFGRRILQWMLMMPLAFPAYILAYIYTDFFDAAGGFASGLNNLHMAAFLPDMRSIWGASFILTFCLYPYIYLFACNGFLAGSKSQIESGKLLNAGPWSQFFDIALPSARPFILVGLMLVIMEVLADYGTMDYFGLRVFSTVIYDAWAGYGDITAAARLSLILLVFVLLLVWAEKMQRRQMRFSSTSADQPEHHNISKAGLWASIWCTIPVIIGFIFPTILLLTMIFKDANFNNLSEQFITTLPYLTNSLILCVIVAIIGVMLSFILTTYKRTRSRKHINILFDLCGFGYALPGIILGLGLLLVSSLFSQLGLLMTGTLMFLILGYLIRFLNVSLRGLEAGYEKISPSLDQASQLMRDNAFIDFWQIKLPLLTPAMLSAGLILAVEVIKELPLTLVLRPFDFDTLAVRAYHLASDERLTESAFPALFIVALGCVPIILVNRFLRSPK